MTWRGRCLCGEVSYEAQGEPIATAVCHCRNCQRQGGGAMSINVMMPQDAVTVSGELKTFEDRGESGNDVSRLFCPICGSPILSLLAASPGFVIIKAGTLDDPASVSPQVQIWCASAQPWVKLEGLPAFERNPPSG